MNKLSKGEIEFITKCLKEGEPLSQVLIFLYFLLQDSRHVPLRGFFEVLPLRLPLMCHNGY